MRLAGGVEYDGGAYRGWQAQPGQATVQGCVESALCQVAGGAAIATVCAGRTDAGVHALNQVVHFDTAAERDEKAWVFGANANLPPDIRIHWVAEVSEDFSARFNARYRDYRYLIRNTRTRPALAAARCGWWPQPLDADAMHSAAQQLLGEHDFSAFRAAECQAHSPMRHLQEIRCERQGDWLMISVRANAFLHHMVRNIVGSLVKVGQGERSTSWIAEVLQQRDRRLAGETAPAQGLYFLTPGYPDTDELPQMDGQRYWAATGLPCVA